MEDYGIDYSLGKSNFNPETGIRFGVISMHDVLQSWCDTAEPEYPCHDCDYEQGDDDCAMADCEAISWYVDDGEYKASTCLDTDIMILESPYFTCGKYCSPCVPGAINLNNPVKPNNETKAYCFGHDWFDSGKAPYRVFSVETGKEIFPN